MNKKKESTQFNDMTELFILVFGEFSDHTKNVAKSLINSLKNLAKSSVDCFTNLTESFKNISLSHFCNELINLKTTIDYETCFTSSINN